MRICRLLVQSPDEHSGQGCVGQSRSLFLVSQRGSSSKTWAIFHCVPRRIGRELSWEVEPQDLNGCMWVMVLEAVVLPAMSLLLVPWNISLSPVVG